MIALAGLAGALIVAGAAVLIGASGQWPAAANPARARRRLRNGRHGVGRRAWLATGAGLAVLAVTRWPVAAMAAVGAVLFLPRILSARAAQEQTAVLEGLEQWARRLSDMLLASRGLEDALEVSARSAPAAIKPAVTRLSRRLSARTGTEAALRAFAAEFDDPAADRIAAALIIATGRRGGGVASVLESLATMLAADVAARREIEAERAQHRTSVRWLTGFIIGFTAIAAVDRSYSAPYGTLAGQLVLALVLALYAASLAWLHRLGSVRTGGRFLSEHQEFGRPAVVRTRRPW